MIDFDPTDEQKLIVETVRQFAANEIRPRARECDEVRKLPDDVIAQAHELGLVANALPEAFGGGGERSAVTGCLVAEELAWGDLSIGLAILSPALAALPVAEFGPEALQAEVLPEFLTDRFTPGALALVEPRVRFDPFAPETLARKEGDEVVLSGEKCFVPWQGGGRWLVVVARGANGPEAFVVPRDAAGLAARPERNMGIQGLPTAELELRDVRIPASASLGTAAARSVVVRGRAALASAAVGVARAAFELARDYAKQREAFGAPIATKQAIAFKLADMAIEIDGARLLAWEAAWQLDRGADALREATLAYQQAQRVAVDVCDAAVQVLGGHGYTREYLPEQQLRNARGFASFEGLALV